MISVNVGKNIAQLRKSKGKTAEQLAEALGVSRQTVSKWENGETVPTAYNMIDIATYLDIPISDIYVQMVRNNNNINYKFGPDFDADAINQVLNPRNVEMAIVAYDRNPNKFMVKVGVNVISYSDILLLSTNMGYFKGYSEIENPVSFHEAKDCDKIVPEFVQHLKDNGFIVFNAGGQFNAPEKVINSDFNGVNDGAETLVIIRNEKELLDFKTDIKNLFTGITNAKCERDWCSPSGMKYLLCMSDDWTNKDREFEKKYEYYISHKDELGKESQEILNKAEGRLKENREYAFDECNPIQYIKDDGELRTIREQLASLDEKTLEAFAEACFGRNIGSIWIFDLQDRRFLPLFDEEHEQE